LYPKAVPGSKGNFFGEPSRVSGRVEGVEPGR
jgi:hypothetical protein